MPKSICVFSASSDAVDPAYRAAAEALGAAIGRRGDTLVFGAGAIGLMGACARAVHAEGGRVVGVIPRTLNRQGIVYAEADELFTTDTLRERKAIMDGRADAFVALPGGFGTLEELLEIITLKQLRFHEKPVVILNTQGFYDPLVEVFEHMFRERFTKPAYRALYYLASEPEAVYPYLDSYDPARIEEKWMRAPERP